MNYQATISWCVFSRLSAGLLDGTRFRTLFNQRSGRGFVTHFSPDALLVYFPTTLQPTTRFHHLLRQKIDATHTLNSTGKQFPYQTTLTNLGIETRVNISFRLYFPRLLCTYVSLDSISITNLEVKDLIAFERLSSNPTVCKLLECISDVISGDAPDLEALPGAFPHLALYPHFSGQTFETHIAEQFLDYARILTRHETLTPEIATQVKTKNADHNFNTNILLLDKQGILFLVPTHLETVGQGVRERFKRASRLFEYAYAINLFLRESAVAYKVSKSYTQLMVYGIQHAINNEALAFHNSVTTRKLWSLLSREFSLKEGIGTVTPAIRATPDQYVECYRKAASELSSPHDPKKIARTLWWKCRTIDGETFVKNHFKKLVFGGAASVAAYLHKPILAYLKGIFSWIP